MKNSKPRYFRLTKSENEIMELMWKEGHPLSRSEIIELTPERTWKPSSIHILLNSMLDKNAIEVAGFVQSTKNYARTFMPCVSADNYAVMQIKNSPVFTQQSVPNLLSALVEDVTAPAILDQLEQIVQSRKQELA
ncbi:hypothetical protein D7X94_14415 [Acutalibacter sp. 1XD8-33]|uniref:BlaI/MecI/CopY family transcriptional regulator n=1 Tax=Acutalibacter sp. 1XD8-33 TaxID=2320081 RepID=UPI000EA36E12|nr:BlaI/MecI/CopY family transcriptional regulator [Acutalibacter sp. 1XD8-33]RKJ38932.1 hypothetical protein D7X94_14415 [Acutalibacter sp. 1XD8-33]